MFYRFSQKTYGRMTRVAHSLEIVFRDRGSEVFYMNSNAWRKQVFGNGKISKEDCQNWARRGGNSFGIIRRVSRGTAVIP